MNGPILLYPIAVPLAAAFLVLVLPKGVKYVKEAVAIAATLFNVVLTYSLFGRSLAVSLPWAGFGMDLSLNLSHFSGFIIAATATFAFLIAVYSFSFVQDRDYSKQFYLYLLITLSFVTGAVLSDNLVLMLFFWEGLLATLFGFIFIGGKASFKTAIKAFVITGVADLCLMLGIVLTWHIAGTLAMSKISLALDPIGAAAFTLLMIGAIAKAGSMPFHSWIPDASLDAPLPFMAFLPASIEKLVGIYFLAKISMSMFILTPESWVSSMMMVIGGVTILLAVMMALVQKNYKKLLAYHAISQVGYMILGIGTALPIGIVGGLFHMINNAMYKSCLFLTGGAVEKQSGTADLDRLGGIGAKMPITFFCFMIAAFSISGVPPFNGFFSKELVYDAALERGLVFYLMAVIGSFFTAASFLKLGHAAYLGKLDAKNSGVKEAPWPMLLPIIIIAAACVLFGVFNTFPLHTLIQPVLGAKIGGNSFAGLPSNSTLVIATLIVLALAVLNHLYGVKTKGSGLKAVDHIHYAPILRQIYDGAERRLFDPYDIGLKVVDVISALASRTDKAIDWVYNVLSVSVPFSIGNLVRKCHNGNYSFYLVWSFVGMFVLMAYIFMVR
jgi:formate hydrogenlyase subunit 3/multisubunit Na+/H+ antiporter MnhD subunit